MSKMRQTNIKWIPEISEDFPIGFVKQYFNISKDLAYEGEPERVLKLARAGIVEKDVTTNEGQMAASYEGYNKVESGDLLLNPMDLYSGANCNVSELKGVISPAYSNLRAKDKNTTCSKYYDYFFKTQYWTMAMFAHGKGVSFDNRWTLNNDTLKSYEIPVPPYEKQKAIVAAIESKTTKIDALISNEEKQIEKLKNYKKIMITDVVTKGINKDTKIKNSGIEWLGNIPDNWSTVRVRDIFKKRSQKNNPIVSTERLSLSIDVGITKYAEKTTNLDRFKDDFTEYQLAYPNDIVLNSMNMIVGAVGKSDYLGCVSPVYYVIYTDESNNPDYYAYVLNSITIRQVYHSLGRGIYAIERGEGRVNTCRLKVPYYDFSNIEIPNPSLSEQNEIALFLNNKCEQIERLISLKESKIDKLNAYKKSLIYEYVTGKKEA